MLYASLSQDLARITQAQRLSAAEMHHRLFRRPIATTAPADATVITLPSVSVSGAERSANVA